MGAKFHALKFCYVIGGTGFICFFVVTALLREGRRVIAVGRTELPTWPFSDNVEYIAGLVTYPIPPSPKRQEH
jgi:nucleoside-diphosphate-sugar epimerase